MDLVTALNCPLCAIVIVLVGLLFPQLKTTVGPLLAKLLAALTPSPAAPARPATPDQPASPRPIDLAVTLLIQAAKKKFPALAELDALQRFAVESAHYANYTPDPPAADAK